MTRMWTKTSLALGALWLAGCPGGNNGGVCGDNIVDEVEQCDDGNTTDGDGCSALCENENLEANSPTAVLAVDGTLFVGLINLNADFTPRDGELLVMDPATGDELNRITTSAKQPQTLFSDGTDLYVFNSGEVVFDENFNATVVQGGAVDIFPLDGVTDAIVPDVSISLGENAADVLQGSLGRSAVRDNNGTLEALIGSGLTSEAYLVNLSNRQILRGVNNPISILGGSDFVNVVASGNTFYALSFFTDQACRSDDPARGVFTCQDLGEFPIDDPAGFEGLIDLAITPQGNFLGIFAVAGSFVSGVVEADGSLTVLNRGATGLDPERLAVIGDDVAIAEAGDNTISIASFGKDGAVALTEDFIVLGAGANPRDLATDGDLLFVAAQSGDFVGAFTLADGAEQGIFPVFP